MFENGVVALTNANGCRLAIQLSDGTYALVEQLGTGNVVASGVHAMLSGNGSNGSTGDFAGRYQFSI